MTSSFEVDVNCAYCFDDIIAALRDQPTVTDVSASIGAGCVPVTHDTVACPSPTTPTRRTSRA